MNDASSVLLTVLTSQSLPVQELIGIDEYSESMQSGEYTSYTFHDVNYGELDFLHLLQTKGISYLSEWESGDEYDAGCASCRFTPEGEAIIREIYDSEYNPSMGLLLERIDNPTALRTYILEHKESQTILPWDNQEEYGKIYRVNQLLLNKG